MSPTSDILAIPEVAGLDARGGLLRIPPELDVPLTPRVRRVIDTPQFRRLAKISQLGFVSLVYPGALHTRFEHSLGVYRLGLLYLKRLAHDERFAEAIDRHQAELFIAAALLHDLGHWPFCHAMEDLRLPEVPRHEVLAAGLLAQDELGTALREDWQIEPAELAGLMSKPAADRGSRLLASLLSGPIDIDKMDYLARDSLHAGVPYGRNFDQGRLIGSLCLNAAGDGLAISDKGKTAAEMMVFSRYVMFSEVYWHHGVRSATAMVQRLIYHLHEENRIAPLFECSDAEVPAQFEFAASAAKHRDDVAQLADALFGPTRQLYKRVAQFSIFEQPELYEQLTRRPYPWLLRCAGHFADLAGAALGEIVRPHEILLDAPPQDREVEFRVDVYYPKEDRYRPLAEVSPVVRTLAQEQFDDYVKRVRLFAPSRIAGRLRGLPELTELLRQAAALSDEPS